MNYRFRAFRSLLISLISLSALPCAAQQSAITLDEVTVNGTARSTQTLDKQGVSYTLMDSSFIANNNVRELSDMARYVPGIEIPQYGSRLTSSMYVRGIGSRINSPSVGVYYENIPLLFKGSMNRHFYNVGKMAMLRGPQGTLYGMNSEGGLIVVDGKDILKTANSHDGLNTTAHLGIGNHFQRQAEVGFIIPLLDNFALSADVFYRGTDGYTNNVLLNRKADNADEAGMKLKLDWQANQRLRMSLFAEFQTDHENGFAYGDAVLTDECINTKEVASPASNILGIYKRNIFDTGFNLVYNTGSWRLQSTTAFQYLNDFLDMDQDYSPRNLLLMKQHQNGKAISEELNLKGNITDRWSTSSGVFASYLWLDTDAPVFFQEEFSQNISNTVWTGLQTAVKAMIAAGRPLPDYMKAMAALNFNPITMSMQVPGEFRTPSVNVGVFHESTYHFTKDFSATLGLRYDFNRQDLNYNTSMLTDLSISLMGLERKITSHIENSHHRTSHQVLPKLSLRLKDWYLTVSKGYRAGGYNIQMFSDILQKEFMGLQSGMMQVMSGDIDVPHDAQAYKNIEETISYDPELSWNYELGGRNTINGSRTSVSLQYAAFYTRVRDLQLSIIADTYGFGRMMKNAGNSTSCGAELSVSGASCFSSRVNGYIAPGSPLFEGLIWSANYSYTYTKFLDNKRVPFIPSHIVHASLGYKYRKYSAELNMNGRGKIYWDEDNTYSQPFYAQMGAKLAADFGKVSVSIWARNILNYRPVVFAFSSTTPAAGERPQAVKAQLGEPFMTGIDFHLSF